LAEQSEQTKLRVWQFNESKPWFRKRGFSEYLRLNSLKLCDIMVEKYLYNSLFGLTEDQLPINITGIKPDIFIKIKYSSQVRYYLIENKMKTIETFTSAQKSDGAYVKLINLLNKYNMHCEYLVLTSCGVHNNSFWKEVREIQQKLKDKNQFGLILWEDIIRQMASISFKLPGIDIDDLKMKYTECIDTDSQWD
jgi:hypothetical protein